MGAFEKSGRFGGLLGLGIKIPGDRQTEINERSDKRKTLDCNSCMARHTKNHGDQQKLKMISVDGVCWRTCIIIVK